MYFDEIRISRVNSQLIINAILIDFRFVINNCSETFTLMFKVLLVIRMSMTIPIELQQCACVQVLFKKNSALCIHSHGALKAGQFVLIAM